MTGLDQFLEFFGNVTLAQVISLGLAIFFVVFICMKFTKYLHKKWEAQVEKDKKFKEAMDQISQYPKWRQQSIDIQQQFNDRIEELKNAQEQLKAILEEQHEEMKRRERNKLREKIITSYRYYINRGEWTRMEADAFWELFGDYEDADGNGYVHTVVQPAMNLLKIIDN